MSFNPKNQYSDDDVWKESMFQSEDEDDLATDFKSIESSASSALSRSSLWDVMCDLPAKIARLPYTLLYLPNNQRTLLIVIIFLSIGIYRSSLSQLLARGMTGGMGDGGAELTEEVATALSLSSAPSEPAERGGEAVEAIVDAQAWMMAVEVTSITGIVAGMVTAEETEAGVAAKTLVAESKAAVDATARMEATASVGAAAAPRLAHEAATGLRSVTGSAAAVEQAVPAITVSTSASRPRKVGFWRRAYRFVVGGGRRKKQAAAAAKTAAAAAEAAALEEAAVKVMEVIETAPAEVEEAAAAARK